MPKPEATEMSFRRWMGKQTGVHLDNGILFSIKKKRATEHEKTWRKLNAYNQVKEAIWKVCLLCESNYTTFWQRQDNGDSQKISGCEGLAERELRRQSREGFRAVKLLYERPSWWIHIITYFSKPIEWTVSRVNPSVNYGLWVIMVCPFKNQSLSNREPLSTSVLSVFGTAWSRFLHDFSPVFLPSLHLGWFSPLFQAWGRK